MQLQVWYKLQNERVGGIVELCKRASGLEQLNWNRSAISIVTLPELNGLVIFQRGGSDDIFTGMTRSAQNNVCVASQLLHHFFGLQVPDVNEIIFGARHDPLAPGDWEVGEDAVLLVLVARVGFEALR